MERKPLDLSERMKVIEKHRMNSDFPYAMIYTENTPWIRDFLVPLHKVLLERWGPDDENPLSASVHQVFGDILYRTPENPTDAERVCERILLHTLFFLGIYLEPTFADHIRKLERQGRLRDVNKFDFFVRSILQPNTEALLNGRIEVDQYVYTLRAEYVFCVGVCSTHDRE